MLSLSCFCLLAFQTQHQLIQTNPTFSREREKRETERDKERKREVIDLKISAESAIDSAVSKYSF